MINLTFRNMCMCILLSFMIFVITVSEHFICLNFHIIRPAAEVGRQLARLGDEINEKYSEVFDRMIAPLNLTGDNAYEAFACIARGYA